MCVLLWNLQIENHHCSKLETATSHHVSSNLTWIGGVQGSIARAGGIIRDFARNWIQGFQRQIGTTTSTLAAEIWALRDGLKLITVSRIHQVEIDSKFVIDIHLLHTAYHFHPLSNLIDDRKAIRLDEAGEQSNFQAYLPWSKQMRSYYGEDSGKQILWRRTETHI